MTQLYLLPPTRPRAKPRVMANVIDAGFEVLHVVCECGFDAWVDNPGDKLIRKVACPECAKKS